MRRHPTSHVVLPLLLIAAFVAVLCAGTSHSAPRNDVPIWPYPASFQDAIATGAADPSETHHLCIPDGVKSVDLFVDYPSDAKSEENVKILKEAIERYKREIFLEQHREWETYERISNGRIDLWYTLDEQRSKSRQEAQERRIYPLKNRVAIRIHVKSVDEPLQLEGVDESYSIEVRPAISTDEKPNDDDGKSGPTVEEYEINVSANQLWGALRALETLAQLVQYNLDHREETKSLPRAQNVDMRCMYKINNVPVKISDKPRFPWRGLMIDSSRHFLPVPVIKRIMDGMVSAKLNVLHWHLTDAQSFPFFVSKYPLLSEKGSFADHLTYSRSDLEDLVAYATKRGIRVVPELDMPGHAFSWGLGYENLTVKCETPNINNIPLNPTVELVYEVIDGIVEEFREVFPDAHIHFGADELAKFCWRNDPNIQQWMKDNDMADEDDLWGYFQDRLQKIISAEKYNAPRKIVPVYWQEIFTNLKTDKFELSKDSVITAWHSDAPSIKQITDSGFKALFNEGWYLDKQKPYQQAKNHWLFFDTWEDMYLAEPLEQVDPENAHLVLGGEACMWGEQIDLNSVESRIFPRASAAAERLWSPKEINDLTAALDRIIHHSCHHLSRKGVRANTIRPDYCPHTYTVDERPFLTPLELAAVVSIVGLAATTILLLVVAIASVAAAIYFYKRLDSKASKYRPLNY